MRSNLFIILHRFDDLDMKLLYELTKDGSISVPVLSKKLGINASVLYSRIKRLMKKKLIKMLLFQAGCTGKEIMGIYYL